MLTRTRMLLCLATTGLIAGAFLAGRVLAAGIPAAGALTYSGVLEGENGEPLTGKHTVEVRFWAAESGGDNALCTNYGQEVALESGRFSVALPDGCTDAVKAHPDLWVEVVVDGASLGRAKAGAVPFAVEAGHATSADSAASASEAVTATNATHATSADSATTATNAAQLAGDGPESFQRPLDGSCDSGIAAVAADGTTTCTKFVVFQKPGNNGTASCDTFCAGSEWGATGTCVGAQKADTLEYVTCHDTNVPEGNLNGLYCWCSRPVI
ncbi:MAG: hypothetical protein JW940_20500 [Polyangiaceae bacterium]|nr:hypothetical protein [Polyangiaceae bacterium]